MSGMGTYSTAGAFGSYIAADEATATATIIRWSWSDWPPLVRGQRVTMWDREWRVTDVYTDFSGHETYSLEPAEVVDARIAAEREAR